MDQNIPTGDENQPRPGQAPLARVETRRSKAKYWVILILSALAITVAVLYQIKQSTPDLTIGVSPIAIQSPTSTAANLKDWKTYTNSQYGIEFRYPAGWTANDTADGIVSLYYNYKDYNLQTQEIADLVNVIIAVDKNANPKQLTARQWFDEYKNAFPKDTKITLDQDGTFNSINFVKIERLDFLGDRIETFIPRGTDIFDISYGNSKKNNNTYNQILSTFKFTSPQTDTSGWKTYTNSQYGFSFQYPTDLSIQNDVTSSDLGTYEHPVSALQVGQMKLSIINTPDLHKKVTDYLKTVQSWVGGLDSAACTDIQKLSDSFSSVTTYNCGAEGFSALVQGNKFDIFAEKLFQDPYDDTTVKILSSIKFTK